MQRTGGADLGPHLKEAVCWVDNGVMSDELSRALRARGCRPTENRADAAIYIVSDPNDPGRRVRWYAMLKGAFVVTGRSYVLAAGEGGRRGAFSHRKFCDFSLDGKTHKSEDFSQHDLSLQNLWGTN